MGPRDQLDGASRTGRGELPPAEALLRMPLRERTQTLLECLQLRPRRSLSQNFLISDTAASQLVDAVTDAAGPDTLIIEIGAGLGALTIPLAQSRRELVAFETDPHLIPALRLLLEPFGNARLEHADITQVDLADLAPGRRLAVAGNLPYHLTGLILRSIMEIGHRCDVAVVTVQAEVGARLSAKPGDDAYGVLSVFAAYYLERVEMVRKLGPGVFLPRPDVDSVALALAPRTDPARAAGELTPSQEQVLLDVIRAGFGHRRKTLRNSLATSPLLSIDKRAVGRALAGAGVDGGARAEQLPPAAFVRIAVEIARDREARS